MLGKYRKPSRLAKRTETARDANKACLGDAREAEHAKQDSCPTEDDMIGIGSQFE